MIMRLHTRTKTTRDVALKRFSDKRFLLSIFSTMLILASTLTATSSASAAPSNPIGISETILSAGDNHVCDITTEGIVRCWGSNLEGQTTPPENLGTIKQISSGATHTCAIKTDNTAQCWGSNLEAQSTPPEDLGTIKQISSGATHTCAIKTDNTAQCWGSNLEAQSTPPEDLGTIKQISSGATHTCAINPIGNLKCWGQFLGQGFPKVTLSKVSQASKTCVLLSTGKLTLLHPSRSLDGCYDSREALNLGFTSQISSGVGFTCARLSTGKTRCWSGGDLDIDNLGVTESPDFPPVAIGPKFISIDAGTGFTCGIKPDKSAICTGGSDQTNYGAQTVPAYLGPVKQISAGEVHTCAIKTDNTAQCWGYPSYSELPRDLGTVKQISAGSADTCAIKTNNTAQCWGNNFQGQGNVPADLGTIKQISVGDVHTCAIKTNNTAQCWGRPRQWQIYAPENLGTVKQISTGGMHTCAIKTNNTAQCWGLNEHGQASVPSNLGTIIQISVGLYHTCAIKTNNTAQCWGEHEFFDFGQNNPPSTLGKVKQLSSRSFNTCAIKTDDRAICWGRNDSGQHWLQQPVFPPDQPSVNLSNTGKGMEIIVENLYRGRTSEGLEILTPEDGAKTWTAWDAATGKVLCKGVQGHSCLPRNQTLGNTYSVKVVVFNEAGSSLSFLSAKFKNCADSPSISTKLSSNKPKSGSRLIISGQIVNFCPTYPGVIYVREKPVGKSWSFWYRYYISSAKKFSFSRYYKVSTVVEFKAANGNKQVVTTSRNVDVSD